MKKVKFMLIVILAMAIAGGILAFKTTKKTDLCVFQLTTYTVFEGEDPRTVCSAIGQYNLSFWGTTLTRIYTMEGVCPEWPDNTTWTPFCNLTLSLAAEW